MEMQEQKGRRLKEASGRGEGKGGKGEARS